MTIDEAINTLGEILANINDPWDFDQQYAIKLGIEALKTFKSIRTSELIDAIWLFPGETKEW